MKTILKIQLIIVILLFGQQALAIELVINGITYNIDKYEITNNGKRIVINHKTFENHRERQTSCLPVKSKHRYKAVTKINRDPFKSFNVFINSIKKSIPKIKREPASTKPKPQNYQ